MKIKTRLMLGFIILLALMAGITTFGYDRLSRMNDRMNQFYGDRFAKVLGVIDLRGAVNSAGRSVEDVLSASKGESADKEDMDRQIDEIKEKLKTLSAIRFDPQEQLLLDQVSRDSESYVGFLERFSSLAAEGKNQEASELNNGAGRTSQDNIVGSLDAMVTFEQKMMEQEVAQTREMYAGSIRWVAVLTVIGLFLGLGVILWVFPNITSGLNLLTLMARKFSQGRLKGFRRLEIKATDELGELARVFQQIALDLQEKNEREAQYNRSKEQRAWIDSQTARTAELLRDVSDLKAVSQSFIEGFSPVLGAAYGALYLLDNGGNSMPGRLYRYGTYAYSGSERTAGGQATIEIGEGLVGQCALNGEPMTVEPLPPDYMPIRSGLGETEPVQLYLQPVKADGRTIGIVELAYLAPIGELQRELLERISEKFAYIVMNIQSRYRVEELLRESQSMTEELQAQSEELITQQEELRETNEKLELHAERLKRSEERLQRQQEELEHTNQELTVKTLALEEQNRQSERKNHEIASANAELERRAMQLSLASRYKSEFLANMSHELRTPLNSLIILSQFLTDNSEGNLTDKQLEYVSTIHSSGNDLLKMIDEILDLAKVDAGRMDIYAEQMLVEDITTDLEHVYRSIAEKKGVAFELDIDPEAPRILTTDGHRLKQILRNLLSNAVKFTSEGSIALRVKPGTEETASPGGEKKGEPLVVFEVEDTGIGIPKDKREIVFEAFRQADGTTSRKFGGTGLGLTISRELARLLGGRIELDSEPGRGSRFSLLLPVRCPKTDSLPDDGSPFAGGPPPSSFGDEISAAAQEPPGLAPPESPLPVVEPQAPQSEPEKRFPSAKPRSESPLAGKTILLVDDDPRNVFSLTSLLNHYQIEVVPAENGREALERLEDHPGIDLVLMDIMMPEMDGFEAMTLIRSNPKWRSLPVIALTAKAMKEDRDKSMRAGASDYLAKPVMVDQLLSLLKVWLSR
ncbi:response regulator [Cohnella zeiphila]|uniref:Circadian input-output histidine kinase CikA n=1 Tax=Cohnella zeiphila TaxID=2761120 RepID=A0A7X0VW20_9BACL|nr:response regulator [Cohnella zeiphila]MBB6731977.1 response regulator [Cohnella zeiphila]